MNELALYAQLPERSRGRRFPEKEHAYRSVFQRDRDRIIYSSAFRRLQYKTQVFVNHEGDQYRTRLTHTLEVVQISRTIAKALKLNEELVEAIALAHDLGHTPFGHAGEYALRELMKEHGGFEHNLHGLRVVDYLEERYPDFPGLNLTWEVREGIIRHCTYFDCPQDVPEFSKSASPSLEAQVVEMADLIAYNNHDLDDGILSGLLRWEQLEEIELWNQARLIVEQEHPDLKGDVRVHQIIRCLINLQVSDLIRSSSARISELKIESADDVRDLKARAIGLSDELSGNLKQLSGFLLKNLYRHFKVVRMTDKAQRFLKELFEVYLKTPEQLPYSTQKRLKSDCLHRVICDYVAGMTDRYALDEYKKLFHPWEKV